MSTPDRTMPKAVPSSVTPAAKARGASAQVQGSLVPGSQDRKPVVRALQKRAPIDFNPDDWPIAWMARAERQHARNSTALLKPLGLHHREFRLMVFLGRNPEISVGRLAELSVLERPTVSKMLDRLEAEGLVHRGANEGDRRLAPLMLTPAGQARLKAATPIVESLFREYQDHMSSTEHKRFVAALQHFFFSVRAAEPGRRAQSPKGPRKARLAKAL